MAKLGTRISGAVAAAVIVGSLLPTAAQAATDAPSIDDLSAQQQQAIAAWEAGATNQSTASGSAPVAARAAVTSATAAASGTNSMKLYRGSWLMWAEENVNFSYSGSSVTWSEAYQKSGWVIPNTVKQNGTKRVYNTSARHDLRGSYTVGAGVPTPWGNANVYSATSIAFSRVLSIGSWQKWED